MKKKSNVLSFIAVYTAALMGIIALSCSFCSCNKGSWFTSSEEKTTQMEQVVDSIVNERIQDIINPVFSDEHAVLVYRDLQREQTSYDSIFNVLPDNVLKQITVVLLKRENVASKRMIIAEYLAHPDIYPFLDDKISLDAKKDSTTEKKIASIELVKEEKTTVTEAPPTRVDGSVSAKDTTIDGKQVTLIERR